MFDITDLLPRRIKSSRTTFFTVCQDISNHFFIRYTEYLLQRLETCTSLLHFDTSSTIHASSTRRACESNPSIKQYHYEKSILQHVVRAKACKRKYSENDIELLKANSAKRRKDYITIYKLNNNSSRIKQALAGIATQPNNHSNQFCVLC